MSSALTFRKDADGIGWIRFEDPDRKVNVLTQEVMEALGELALSVAAETDLRGLVLESAKPDCFLAGADLELIRSIQNPTQGADLARRGQAFFTRFAELRIPTVASVRGTCLGGGLELALCCDWIVAGDDPKTKLGLPEVQLGILPGLGGTQRLPRRIGLPAALDLILSGRQLSAFQAARSGLADEACPPELLAARARHWIGRGKRPARRPPGWILTQTPLRALAVSAARKQVRARTGGHYPAPLEAIGTAAAGLSRGIEAGLAAEAEAFGRLSTGGVSKQLVRLFFLRERFTKPPAEAKDASRRAAVVGAGVMGGGIANLLASRGISARLKDIAPEPIAKALATVRDLNRRLEKEGRAGRIEAAERLRRVAPTLDYTGLAGVDVVVEAVIERLDLKQKVFAELEQAAGPDAILCSNTSSLSVSRIAERLARPERAVGLHFFNPVHRMPLVEVIPGERTAREVVDRTVALSIRLGKVPVVVKDAPGFLVNRILLPYVSEAVRCWEEGARAADVDRALLAFGMPMGPLELADEVGIDVGTKVAHILSDAFGERMRVPASMDRIAEGRWLGKKTSAGFYLYRETAKGPRRTAVNPAVDALRAGFASAPPDGPEIVDRCVLTLANEAARCLEEGVVADADALDVAMIFGTGFPPFRGGLWTYARERGLPAIRDRLQELAGRMGPRFAPAASLS